MEITKEKFYKSYGGVFVKFKRYYKYVFTYEATLENGDLLTVSCGGCSDGIYRFELIADVVESVHAVAPYKGAVFRGGVEMVSFYEDS